MAGFSHGQPTEFNAFRTQLNGLLATLQKLPVGEKQTAINLLKVTVKTQLQNSAPSKAKQNLPEPGKYFYQDRGNHCPVQEEGSQGSESEFDQHPSAGSEGQDIDEDLCLNHEVPQSQVLPQPTHLKHSIEENLSFNILHHLSETDCLESTLTETESTDDAELPHKESILEKEQNNRNDICSKVKTKNDCVNDRREDGMLIQMTSESRNNILDKRSFYIPHNESKNEGENENQQHGCLESLGKYNEVLNVSEQDRLLGTGHEQVAVPMLSQSEQQLALITSRDFCEGSREASEFGAILHSQDPDRDLHVLEEHNGHNSQEYGSGESLLQLRVKNEKKYQSEGKLASCDKNNSFDDNSCNSLNLSHFHNINERDSIYSEDHSYLLRYLEKDHYEKIEYKIDTISRKSNQDGFGRVLETSTSCSNGNLDCCKRRETHEEMEHDKTPVDLSSTSSIVQNVKIEECIMAHEGSPTNSHQPQGAVFSSEPSDVWNEEKSKPSKSVRGQKQKRACSENKRHRHTKYSKTSSSEENKLIEVTDTSASNLHEREIGANLDLNNSVLLEETTSCVRDDNQCHGFEGSLPVNGQSAGEKCNNNCNSEQGVNVITCKPQYQKETNTSENKEPEVLPSSLQPVSCKICKKELPDISLFMAHQRQCEGHLSCTICQAKFVHKVTYIRHMEGHKRNICSKCSQSFCSHKKLKAHMKSEHNFDLLSKTYPCHMCSRSFLKRSSLYYHLKVHASDEEEVCQKCGAFIKGTEPFNLHMADHHKATKFHCHICSASFKRRQQYDDHLMHHKKNRCEICGQPFTTKRALIRHCRHEHNRLPQNITLDREYKCDKCDRVFNRPSLLRHHLQLHRGVKLECRLCNKQFSHKRGLRKHMNSMGHEHTLLTNSLEKDHAYDMKQNFAFTCEYCGLKLPTRHLLSKHSKLAHKVGITWQCPHCDYTTKRNHTLKRHMELHLESRNYMCEICGSSFQALATLKDHYNFVHSDERNYKCPECDKCFKNKSSLARHSRTHSDDRPYKCHCGTTYKRLSHLKRHSSSAHKEIMKSRAVKKLKRSEDMDTNIDDSRTGQDQSHSKEFSEECEEFEFVSINNSSLSPVIQTDASVKGTSDILLPTQESIILMGENSDSDQGHLITVGDSQIIQLIPSTFQFPQESSFQTVSLVSASDLHAIPLSTPSSYSQGGHSGPVVVEPFSLSQSSETMVMVPDVDPLGDSDTIPTTLRTLENGALAEPGRIRRELTNHGIKQEIALPSLEAHAELPVSPSLDTYDYSGAAASPQTTNLLPALPPPHFITHAHSHNTSQDMLQSSLIISDFVLPVEGNR